MPQKRASPRRLKLAVDPHVFKTYIKLIRFEKKQQIGHTRGAPKKSVPEEAKIGHSSTPVCLIYLKLNQFAKNEETGRTHGAPRKRIFEEGNIGRSSTPLTFELTLS